MRFSNCIILSVWICFLLFFFVFYFSKKRVSSVSGEPKETIIKRMYRQSARYAIAATQDESEIIALLHANYAMGYFGALRDFADPKDFKEATGHSIEEFGKRVVQIQDATTRRMIKKCPSLIENKDRILLEAMYSSAEVRL